MAVRIGFPLRTPMLDATTGRFMDYALIEFVTNLMVSGLAVNRHQKHLN